MGERYYYLNLNPVESWLKKHLEEAERIKQYEWDETIGPYCNGLTYLEIEQLNNTYNNY